MKVQVSENAVPIVISYRKIIEKPKLVRRRTFVGPVQFVKNALVKVIDFIEEAAFTTETEVIDPGHSVSVHWAIQVEDPWDAPLGREANLIAYRMANDMPPCGAHFEIITPPEADRNGGERPANEPAQKRPIVEDAPPTGKPRPMYSSTGGKFVRPPDPAYEPRPVQPLVQDDGGVSGPLTQVHHEQDDASIVDLDDEDLL